jgi:hypothetical protein
VRTEREQQDFHLVGARQLGAGIDLFEQVVIVLSIVLSPVSSGRDAIDASCCGGSGG